MDAPNFKAIPHFSRGFCSVDEAETLWNACIDKKPKQILEFGRRCGISTTLFGLIAKIFDGIVYSLDGTPRPEAENNLKQYGVSNRVKLINDWSPWVNFDFSWDLDILYIDGDHKYVSALVDYHVFNYFLKKGGYVVFHDSEYRPVAEAIKQIVKRDRLKSIANANQLTVWEKTDKQKRVYYQFPNYEFPVK